MWNFHVTRHVTDASSYHVWMRLVTYEWVTSRYQGQFIQNSSLSEWVRKYLQSVISVKLDVLPANTITMTIVLFVDGRIVLYGHETCVHVWIMTHMSALYLQYVAVCCIVLHCCVVLHYVAVCCSVLQCVAVCCSVLQCAAVCCSVLQYVTACCSELQCVNKLT